MLLRAAYAGSLAFTVQLDLVDEGCLSPEENAVKGRSALALLSLNRFGLLLVVAFMAVIVAMSMLREVTSVEKGDRRTYGDGRALSEVHELSSAETGYVRDAEIGLVGVRRPENDLLWPVSAVVSLEIAFR